MIGVYDYNSLVECLGINFAEAFPDETMRDPQDAIQRMAATIMQFKLNMECTQAVAETIVKRFDAAIKTAPGVNPAWTENGVRAFAVETLRKVLESK